MNDLDSVLRTPRSLLIRLRTTDDENAWHEFVVRYGGKIFGWCRGRGLQESDAEDVTQNVLLKLAERLRTFEYDPKFRFRCYLKTLTRTACHDYVAAKKKSVAGSGDSEVVKILEQVEAQDDLATRLEAAFDQELLQLAALAVKKRVDDNTWEAFRLMAQEGKSGAEVAEALHMQVGTVFKAKSKVQKMLREEIEKLEGPS